MPICEEIVILSVNCTYGRGAALGRMRRDFHPRTLSALAGPNGCGKTTLLATIAGEIAPLDGEVLVGNAATRTGTTGVALVAEPVFLPDLTVGEHRRGYAA